MKGFNRRIRDSASGPATYIAEGATLTGTLKGRGSYVVCGTFDGNCDVDGPVTLAAGGSWKGILKAVDVVIAGKVDGDVIASQRVEVVGTAHVTGSITGNSIAVAEGAVIAGDIKVTSGATPVAFTEKRRSETP
jgi:cytoskeletal protein CcmA (bactofilin family)